MLRRRDTVFSPRGAGAANFPNRQSRDALLQPSDPLKPPHLDWIPIYSPLSSICVIFPPWLNFARHLHNRRAGAEGINGRYDMNRGLRGGWRKSEVWRFSENEVQRPEFRRRPAPRRGLACRRRRSGEIRCRPPRFRVPAGQTGAWSVALIRQASPRPLL